MRKLSILDKDVVQANPLIEARKEMNVTEMRLFVLGLQDIKPHIKDDTFYDVDFHETIIPYSELKELFGNDFYGNITYLKKQVKKAYNGVIELSYKNGGFGFRHIYKKLDYEPQIGLIIQFDDEIKPYILELVNQSYTRYKVRALFSLSSVYAWRILESLLEKQGFLKQGHKEIFIVLTMEELRFRLNVSDGLYADRINNFRKYVLDEPIREINEKTDYFVWYEVQKTGRKVTGFKLWLKVKPTIDAEATVVEEENTVLELPPAQAKDQIKELKDAMLAESMPIAAINTWIKQYGIEDASASWRLAINHANNRTETMSRGEQRKKYLKYCMEQNIASINKNESEIRKEIDEREKRLAKEKKQKIREMEEGFVAAGMGIKNDNVRGGKKSATEIINPRELIKNWLDKKNEVDGY